MSNSTLLILSAFLSMICFGVSDFTSGVYAKKNGESATIVINNFLGFFIAFALLWINTTAYYQFINLDLNTLLILLLMGLANAIAIVSLIKGFSVGNVGLISGISSSFGLIVVILSALILKENISDTGWIFLGIIISGIILSSYEKSKKRKIILGLPYALTSMILWGLAIFLIIYISETTHWILISFFTFMWGCLLSIMSYIKNKPKIKLDNSLKLMFVSVISELLAYLFLTASSSGTLNTGIIGAITSSYAIIPIILSYIFLRSKLSMAQKAGATLLLIGLIGINLYG